MKKQRFTPQELARHELIQRRKIRQRSALLLALIVHTLVAIVYLFLPQPEERQEADSISVVWVKDIPPPQLRKQKTKPPLKAKVYKPDKRLAREAKNKLSESSPNKITEVAKLSERIVYENVEVNKAPLSDTIPELMTAAELRDAEASNLERLVARPGRTDGQGELTGRVRVKGRGKGRFLVDSDGTPDGLLGGGGDDGIKDRLGIIDFLNEFDGPQQVVYCLDVSASMQAAGLRKLELSLREIQDSLLMLGEDDHYNIITFSARAKVMSGSMLEASMENIDKTAKYLEQFNPERISGNVGTNLLEAIEKGLDLGASIIVLVTDGLPTKRNSQDPIETDPKKILQTVREKNVKGTIFYVVGLEIDLKRSQGAYLLESLAGYNNGRLKIIDSGQLVQFTQPEEPKPEELIPPDLN